MNWIPIKTALIRALRVGASIAISAGISYLANNPKYIILAPIISGVGKYIRESLKLDNIPI